MYIGKGEIDMSRMMPHKSHKTTVHSSISFIVAVPLYVFGVSEL